MIAGTRHDHGQRRRAAAGRTRRGLQSAGEFVLPGDLRARSGGQVRRPVVAGDERVVRGDEHGGTRRRRRAEHRVLVHDASTRRARWRSAPSPFSACRCRCSAPASTTGNRGACPARFPSRTNGHRRRASGEEQGRGGRCRRAKQLTFTPNSSMKFFQTSQRPGLLAGIFSLVLTAVVLLCGAGPTSVENFSPQGAMQADLNAGGHNLTMPRRSRRRMSW